MAKVLDDLSKQVEATVGAEASAVVALNGVAGRIQAAKDEALKNGATEAELAPVQTLSDNLKASADALAAAVVANSPPA